MAVINVNLHQPSSNAIQSIKTPYQKVFSQPVQQEWKIGDKPNNYGQALATINEMYKTNPTGAMEKLNLLNQYRTQPGSKWYDAYAAPTNRDVDTLKAYGIDPTELTSDWFNANNGWQAYLRYNGTTNTPSKPTKKSTDQEKLSYALYQYQKSMGDTSSAKSEWAAAQDELRYWVNRKDLNLSDDAIIQKVFGSNKYKTLKKMDDTRPTGSPLELNEAIDYNPDSVRGVLWAARNGGGTGNSRQDIANYYLKSGNSWKDDPNISAKLNIDNTATYSPHEIGMTGKDMDEVGVYFGVGSFAPGEIEAMRSKVDWEDATSVKMWQKAYRFEQDTLEAEKELAEFNRQFERRLNGRGFSDQNAADKWIEDQLNSGEFNMLAKMDSGIYEGEPINLTRAVPYRKQMYLNAAYDSIANPKKTGREILSSYGMPVSDADDSVTKVENEKVSSSIDALGSFLSQGEKDYFDAVPGVDYAKITAGYNGIAEGMKSGMINITNNATQYANEANGKYNKTWLGSLASRNQYERYQATADRLAAEVDDFEKKNGTQILASESIESEPIFSLDDGTQVQLIYDDETGEYEVGNVWNDMWRFGQTSPEQLAAANEKAEQLRIEQNNRANGIRTAQADAGEMDADTVKGVEEYNKKKEQLAALNGYLEENKAGYEQSIRDAEIAKANRDALGGIAAKALGVEYDPSTADSIMQYAGGWYDYESPPADGITLIEESAGKTNDDIKAEIDANNANIQDLQFVLSMLGDNAPDDLKYKINQAISDAEKQNALYGDYMITSDPRFDYLARKGQESLHYDEHDEPQEGISKIWFPIMTDEEKKIYFALVNRDGIEKADQFYKNIQGELEQRRKNQIEGDAQRMAESGWLGRIASEVGVVLVDEINTLAGAAYTAGVFFGGDEGELSALKIISHVSQSVHNANIAEIKKVYGDPETGEETALSKAISTIYEIGYNRGRSMVNAGTWGMLMPQVSGTGAIANFVNSVLSATPIALSAASDALKNAIDQNATPEQQAIIFASTLIAESWTEAIEFGHIEKAGKLLMTKEGFMQFLKAYPFEALSEVVGETLNDVFENEAGNHWAKLIDNPDYKSEHELAVKKYMAEDDTLTPEQAEAMVYQDEIAGVLHTAAISALSPGADVLSMAGNTIKTYNQYAKEARAYNNGLQPQVRQTLSKSIRDIRLEHEAAQQEQPVRVERPAETPQTEQTEQAQPEQYPVNGPEPNTRNFRERGAYGEAMDAYETGIMTLESAMEGDATAKAAAIAATINTGNSYMAQAAAAKLDIGLTQGLLYAGKQSNINIETLSTGLQLAALGDGMCAQIMNTGIESGMGIYDMAQQIAAAVGADMQNPSVIQGVTAGIHDARVNEEFKRLMATGLAEAGVEAQAKIDAAREATKEAENDLGQRNTEFEVAKKNFQQICYAIADGTIDAETGKKMTKEAQGSIEATAAVVDEYTRRLDNARKNQQNVEDENKKAAEATTAYMRQQAEKTVSQQEQEEAQAKAEAEAQAAAEAEQAAAQEAEKNATEAAEEQKTAATNEEAIRNRLRELGYSDEAIERQVNRIMNRLEEKVRGTENTNAKLSDQEGDKFLRRISRKTGITYEMQDLGDPLKNRGYIVDRNHMVLNSNLTRGQALVEAALHEVTHGIEKTTAYNNYASFVLKAMYGGEGTDAYNKALREKINEYARNGKTLTPEGARQELVAEYARLNLGKKEFARQIATQGLGGKFREILSKAISMLKGYTLDAEGRAKYQEMRTAMKLLNDAINERAQHMKESNNGHTGLVQASITGWTDATGLTLEVTDDDTHVYRLLNNGEEIKPGEYTADMVKGSPVGNLIDMASQANNEALKVKLDKGRITDEEYISQLNKIAETAKQQREYVAKIINMIGQYQDAAMVWELAGSLAFSSLKTNGDPQYSDSYDFGTICTKTQAILNAISETQVRLGRALTKAEIDGVVYEEVGKGVYNKETGKWEHGATPCPPCYVYATWVNKPARLEKVRVYQEECANWTNEQINEFMNRPDPTAKTQSKAKALKTEQNTKKLWISLCLADEVTNPDTGETTWVRKDNPDICPNEILLDLRRSGEMATQHPGTWTFMQKGGNAQGKAIAPYSDARLGESIVAKAMGAGEANARLLEDERNAGNEEYIPQFLNPFLSTDIDSQEAARKIFNKAVEKIKAQNLKGGQRWQSWSDFRAEWGSDYLMEMITMQALGSQVQTYTKVSEALDLLASAGFEVNMSLMPHGDGFWHNDDGSIKIDEDGNMMLRFSPVTGINPEAAAEFAKKYGEKGNVQPMVVGISDEHIKAALAGDFITFVIPFHGSGGSVKRLQHLMSLLSEQMKTGNDYTKAQSDEFEHYRTEGEGKSKKKINTNPNWALREAILTGNYDSLNESQKDAIENNPYLNKLYTDRYIDEDSDAFHVFFSKSEAQQIYPYEYWDTNTTLATADINSQRFIEYCQMLGVKPRFSGLEKVEGKGKNAKKIEYANFSGRSVDANGNVTYNPVKGYWKLLIDRSMYNRVYDENGKIIPEKCTYHKPQAVSTADINIGAMPMAANNTVGHSDDQTREITERIIQRLETGSAQNAAAGSAVDLKQNAEALNKAMYEGSDVQNSFAGNLSDAEMDDIIRTTDRMYMNAVNSGDMETAQMLVDEKADEKLNNMLLPDDSDESGFKYHRGPAPTKTFRRYAVLNVSPDGFRAAYAGNKNPTPLGVWLDAQNLDSYMSDQTQFADGSFATYIVGDTGVPAKEKFSPELLEQYGLKPNQKLLLERGGKHSSDVPNFSQMNLKQNENGNKVTNAKRDGALPHNKLIFEIEYGMSDNGDLTDYVKENGRIDNSGRNQGIAKIQPNQYYDFKTNPNAVGNWGIGGTFRIMRLVPYDEIVNVTNQYKQDAIRDAQQMYENGDISRTDYEKRIKNANAIELQKWVGGYHPEDFGLSVGNVDEMVGQGMQMKLADPVTYDDNGNIIPLSKRFSDKNDIRYSSLGNMTDNEIDEFLNGLALPLEGNNPSATIPSEGNAQRQFGSQTAQRSDELDASVRQFLKDNSGYIPDTNEAQINRAIQWIRSNKNSNESDGLAESIQKIAMEDFDYRSADGQARMIATMGLAVAKKDAIAQAALADAYNRQGTDLGRALQARKLFRLMTPAGRVETLRKMLQNTQDELAAKGRKIDLKFSDWIYMAASEASNEGDFRKVQKRAAEELAAQIPANWKDRVRAIRMLAMLGNTRTHIRNFVGNMLFVPAVGIKNKMAAVAELGMKEGNRTKTIAPILSKEVRDYARKDAVKMKDELTGDSRWNEGNAVKREMKPFKGTLQKLIDFNGNMLEKEDWFFLKGHYRRAFGGWMQANGYTAEQLDSNPALLEKGRAYAIEEAQKATYRDANKLAQTLNKVSREGGVAGFLVDAVLPFKKTPANILRRGIEYSPVGIMKTLTADAVHLKQYMDAKNGKLSVMPDKAISPNQFIDHLCAGLTGSAIMAIGALLASMGIASAGMDDDDDKFDELRGDQKYSLNLSKLFGVKLFGQDVTYTMDWAAPMSMPFFVGAAIFDQLNGERGDFNIENLINDLGAMAEPVFNLSMLDGVNTLFQTSQYDDTNTITQIGGKIVSNYVTSYVPSMVGAIARTFDPVRRKSFVKSGEGGGLMGTWRYAYEQTQNKIPGWSQTNIPYRNAWGEADENSIADRIGNWLSPGYISLKKEDPVLDELERLYNSTEVDDSTRNNLIPKLPNKSVSGTALEAEQYDAVTIQRGQTAKNLLTELMNTDYFKSAADQDRAKMVSDVWTFATQTANNAAVGRKMDGWVLNTQTNPIQGIINRSKKTVADETKDGWKAEAVQAVQMGDFDALDVCIERLGELGVKKSSVKTAVGNAFKEDYIKAYQRDDYATMYDIEGTLEDTGLFTYADFEKWLDDMNKAIIEDEEI